MFIVYQMLWNYSINLKLHFLENIGKCRIELENTKK